MVVMQHRAHFPRGVGAAVSARAEALTQTNLQMIATAQRVAVWSECLGPLPQAGRGKWKIVTVKNLNANPLTVKEYSQCQWLSEQLQWELHMELWVVRSRAKRPWTADPLRSKGHREVWPARWPDTQRYGRSWGFRRKSQEFVHLDCEGIKIQRFL